MRMAKLPKTNWVSVGRCFVVIALSGLALLPIVGCAGGSGAGAGTGGSQAGSGGRAGGQSGSGGSANTAGANGGGGAFGGTGSTGAGGVTGQGGTSGAGGTSASGGAGSGGAAASGGRAGSGGGAGGGSGGASASGGQSGSGGSSGIGGVRLIQNFNQSWKFKRADVSGAEATAFDDSSWGNVGLPHSFSLPYFMAQTFYAGYGWYRKHFAVPASWSGKSVFLRVPGSVPAGADLRQRQAGRPTHRRLQRILDRHHVRHQ